MSSIGKRRYKLRSALSLVNFGPQSAKK